MLNENNAITVDVSDYSAADTLRETMGFYNITQREMATGIPADFLLRADTQYLLETEKKIFAKNMPTLKRFEWASRL